MKMDRLRTLREELDKEFLKEGVTPRVYYYFEDKWHLLDSAALNSASDSTSLDKAQSEAVSYHAPSSRTAWFACSGAGATISLEFETSPNAKKRSRCQTRLAEVVSRASNAFDVNHHHLTLLLGKKAFTARLLAAIDSQDSREYESTEAQSAAEQAILAVFALDIDHFKQVNDSYGHAYGDVVLKIFAVRLEKGAADWKRKEHASAEILVAHPSGEEFLVLFHGAGTRDQVMALADFLRNKIAAEPLPTRDEWDWLQQRDPQKSLTPPPLHERKVTASVGVAFHSPVRLEQESVERVDILLERADTALYRAKAAGRNQVIAFDDILRTCGRVLEQDQHSRVVAIDIGKNVGVTVGQEFLVYPPTFSGQTKFTINDGRTTRTLGVYPRVAIARLTVFNVQPEVSFAAPPDDADSSVTIAVGSHLEAVPLGSIGHLLSGAFRFAARRLEGEPVGDIEAARKFIEANAEASAGVCSIVFRFIHAGRYLKQYGPAALNSALARLFKDVTAAFHAAAEIGVVDSESIVVVGRRQVFDPNTVAGFVDKLGAEFAELGLVAGVFSTPAKPRSGAKGELVLNPRHAIDFATFAASSHATTPKSRVTMFDESTAERILWSQRDSKALEQAWADFERMRSLGLETGGILNQGALIAAVQGRKEQAADLFEKAAGLSDDIIFKSNFATAAVTPDSVDRVLRLLNGLPDAAILELKDKHPYGFHSYACLLAQARLADLPGKNVARLKVVGPIAASLDGYKNSEGTRIIERALALA